MITKKKIPECLNLALEVCFHRDVIPRRWSREDSEFGIGKFGDLYCEAELTEEQWRDYIALAGAELQRAFSSDPDAPVIPASFCEYDENNVRSDKTGEALRAASRLSFNGEEDYMGHNIFEDRPVKVGNSNYSYDDSDALRSMIEKIMLEDEKK